MKFHQKLYAELWQRKIAFYQKYLPQWQQQKLDKFRRILPEHRCIFIHIPKTGGSSVVAALNRLLPKDLLTPSTPTIPKIPKHSKARYVKQALGEQLWEKYYSFAFVRNPWDLMVSNYHWWLQKAYRWKDLHTDVKAIENLKNFDGFMHSKYGQQMLGYPGTMFDWIAENDEVIVDFVGRFENLQQDWNTVCEHFGIAPTTIPHLNKTRRKDYQQYYTPKTQQLVYDRFKKIIELYGYEF